MYLTIRIARCWCGFELQLQALSLKGTPGTCMACTPSSMMCNGCVLRVEMMPLVHGVAVSSGAGSLCLQGDFDYTQLTFAATASTADEEAAEGVEDVSGVGDSLDPLLDVLPGVSGGDEAQAAQYAAELMLPGGLANDSDDEDDSLDRSLDEGDDLEDEGDEELDF